MADCMPRGMRGLAAARSGWDRIEEEETRLLREMTLEEGSRHWLRLQEAFAGQLEETEALFGPERRAALIEVPATNAQAGRKDRPDILGPIPFDDRLDSLKPVC